MTKRRILGSTFGRTFGSSPGKHLGRQLGVATAGLALIGGLTACSGDDGDNENDAEGSGADTSEFAGPAEPQTMAGDCPLTAKQVGTWLGGKAKGKNCAFELSDPQARLSITTAAASDTDAFTAKRADVEESWQNFSEIDVDGEGYVAWSDDELNVIVGYRDNASAYAYTLTAITPELVEADDVPAVAEQIVELTVENRPKAKNS